jgi:hypothetical protein
LLNSHSPMAFVAGAVEPGMSGEPYPARRLGLAASRDTLLRRVRSLPDPEVGVVPVRHGTDCLSMLPTGWRVVGRALRVR